MKENILNYHLYRGYHGRSWRDSMQTAISAKIDNNVMDMVDKECNASGVKRNRLLNLALKWYLEELDNARRMVAECQNPDKYILNIDMSTLPVGELDKFRHICSGFGCDAPTLIMHVVRIMLEDYDKNPYRWMP